MLASGLPLLLSRLYCPSLFYYINNMNPPYITADQTWALWTVLFSAAAFGLWAERTTLGSRLSGAVMTMLLTFLLSNLNLIPSESAAYNLIWTYLVPLAIPLLLVNADLRRILTESGPTLLAFAIGAIGTILGVLLAYTLVPLGEHDWQLAGIFSATYIGGSMNYVSTAKALGLQNSDLLTAGMAADNLMMMCYFLILFSLPSMYRLRSRFHERPDRHRLATEIIIKKESHTGERMNLPGITTALAMSLLNCSLAFMFESRLALQGSAILLITLASVIIATLFRNLMHRLDGAMETGTLFMQLFFATIGASANISTVIEAGPLLLLFAAIILAIHLLVIMVVGRYARLSLPEIVIASNANMGGPTTAAAMAAARRWHALMVPAVLCGTLGYAGGSFIGIGIGKLLQP